MSGPRLEKDDSETTGFVIACLFQQAVDLEELRAWADHVLLSETSCPSYITELSLFDGDLKDIFRVIGFVPSSGLSPSQDLAVLGIAYARGRAPFDPEATESQALAALTRHPEVWAAFRATFPFLV